MVADLGTRKGAKITDIVQDSVWINGLVEISVPPKLEKRWRMYVTY